MNSDNIFKKYIGNEIPDENKSNNISVEKNNIYVPPSKRILQSENLNTNIFKESFRKNSLKQKLSSKPLYRVTEDKLKSLDVFPELNKKNLIINGNTSLEKSVNNDENQENKEWIKKGLESNIKDNIENEEYDNSKLYIPEGWLLLSDLNKNKSISQIEKEREDRFNNQILAQYYANMQYLMKERNAIKRRLYITVGDYFGYDSVILRDIPLKLDFLNESDNDVDDNNSDTDEENHIENEYDEDERF